ncbi:twin-arginine translocase TatA/TatE family subunit [Mucilaginibacter sp. UR6-11]|uniref:Sec-independent protein translocase subunit TatA/TatB n=1 Tax=Mucilaginibacter sp. UR6-11 TaxID=1435644 RepID=UPI001E37341C|nr:twin-arginine translocase TatA/TatE family subunit [Mucilaginibacter sp. UR6-11]MCC8425224.1 twin-arginine translocase TatA/TatE family subunit [Mucilaginibacter sp. UR6-11]
MFSSVFLFFEFTAPEIMLILFVTLLLFGGDKLPGLAKGLGKGIREFKDASEGVKREINNQIDNYDSKKKAEPAKTEETPLIAEHSTDNADGKAEETPAVNVSPVANTVPVGTSHIAATDNVGHNIYDGTAESNEELHSHYRGVTENQEPVTHVSEAGNATKE